MLLKVIVIIIVIYYVLKIVMRLLAPFLAQKMIEKAAENFEKQFNNPYYNKRPETKEGETYIDKKPQEPPSYLPNDDEGEFTDYEEID